MCLLTEEVVVYVKREMKQRGFQSKTFHALPRDMNRGSQELLLSFGWLLSKENIIHRFMVNCSSPIQDNDRVAVEQVCILIDNYFF